MSIKSDQSSKQLCEEATEIFLFALFCGASKDFMKTLKAFLKPFEASQRRLKIKFKLIFILQLQIISDENLCSGVKFYLNNKRGSVVTNEIYAFDKKVSKWTVTRALFCFSSSFFRS